jgi:hypothetical protein
MSADDGYEAQWEWIEQEISRAVSGRQRYRVAVEAVPPPEGLESMHEHVWEQMRTLQDRCGWRR